MQITLAQNHKYKKILFCYFIQDQPQKNDKNNILYFVSMVVYTIQNSVEFHYKCGPT